VASGVRTRGMIVRLCRDHRNRYGWGWGGIGVYVLYTYCVGVGKVRVAAMRVCARLASDDNDSWCSLAGCEGECSVSLPSRDYSLFD